MLFNEKVIRFARKKNTEEINQNNHCKNFLLTIALISFILQAEDE